MDLTYSAEHQAFRREVLVFLEAHRHAAPKGGGAAQRPSAEAVAWQKLLIAHGYAARTIPTVSYTHLTLPTKRIV